MSAEPTSDRKAWVKNAAALASNAANKLDCAVQLSGDTLSFEIDLMEAVLDRVAKRLLALNESTNWIVCLACGQITPEEWWTYWNRDEEDDHWVGAPPGEEPRMMLCRSCLHEHIDDDSNPGVLDGFPTYIEALAARRGEEPDHADLWEGALDRAKAMRANI